MGIFCTTTSIETLMTGTVFSGLTALASECITQAEDEIRKVLARRYDVSSAYFQTSTSVPPAVIHIAKWLSTGYTYEANARGGKEAYERADRYIKKANTNLDAIIEGKASLYDTSGSLIPERAGFNFITSTTSDYSNTFNEDDQLNWSVDPDKLDDISSERD